MAAEYTQHRQVNHAVLSTLLQYVRVWGTSKVLEVGCGTGNYIIALEALTQCSAWGIDPSEQMLYWARKRSEKVAFQIGKAEELEFPDAFFDLVFSVDVIHHVSNCLKYFQEAHRVLETGGRISTTTESERMLRHRVPLSLYFPETVRVNLARYPRIADLRRFMKDSGFHDIAQNTVKSTYELTDIQAYRDKAFSSLHLIPEESVSRGIKHMEHTLEAGPLQCVSRALLISGVK